MPVKGCGTRITHQNLAKVAKSGVGRPAVLTVKFLNRSVGRRLGRAGARRIPESQTFPICVKSTIGG